MTIKALRTPDKYFEALPGFDFKPNYTTDLPDYEELRVHYLDEGAPDARRVFLCLHGQPTWSYLYRKMIPVFLETGARVICPDWLGFGKSDKPVDGNSYSFHFHRTMMLALIEQLDLQNITLVCQDWGGIIGLTLPMALEDRFDRLLVMNTTLATGASPGPGFDAWRAFCKSRPDLDVAALMLRGTPILDEAEAAAYAAPFPDITYKAGVRRFPEMVMTTPDMEGVATSKQAANWWTHQWTGKSFMAIGAADPVLGPPSMSALHQLIRNCPPPMVIEQAGHFVQEWGEDVARQALNHWGDLPKQT